MAQQQQAAVAPNHQAAMNAQNHAMALAQAQQQQQQQMRQMANLPNARQNSTPVMRTAMPPNLTADQLRRVAQAQAQAQAQSQVAMPPPKMPEVPFPPPPVMQADDPSEGPSTRLEAFNRYQQNHLLMNLIFDPLTVNDILTHLVPKLPLPPSYSERKEEAYSVEKDKEGLQGKLQELEDDLKRSKAKRTVKVPP
jgi:hypothetical protein